MTSNAEHESNAGGPVPPAGGPTPGPQEQPDLPEAEVVDAEVVGADEAAGKASEPATSTAPEGEVVEGEVVEPTSSGAAEADALLAEALDADAIEAQFSAAEADAAAAAAGGAGAAAQVAALTGDLQRVHAEYSNYRKRVERDRELVRDRAVEAVLVELLPILDDIGRARDHDELVGGFRSVGEALEGVVNRLGLESFGTVGEPFDPTRHEALMREEREGVTEPTVVNVFQAGYAMKGRIVRPARVSVAGTD
ncbi:MAG TPA: nucleotide exchange factor GrpE [Candidatus Nanopelagicales bacterium]